MDRDRRPFGAGNGNSYCKASAHSACPTSATDIKSHIAASNTQSHVAANSQSNDNSNARANASTGSILFSDALG